MSMSLGSTAARLPAIAVENAALTCALVEESLKAAATLAASAGAIEKESAPETVPLPVAMTGGTQLPCALQ